MSGGGPGQGSREQRPGGGRRLCRRLSRWAGFERRMIGAWLPGFEHTIALPREAGFLAGPGHGLSLLMNIHYHNPEHRAGWRDATALRVYATVARRKFDAGIMWTGAVAQIAPMPRNERRVFSQATCAAPHDAVVVGAFGHVHGLGRAVFTEQLRGGVKVGELGRDDAFQMNRHHYGPFARPYRAVQVGDTLSTTCIYDNSGNASGTHGHVHTHGRHGTHGGIGHADEMCVNFLVFYPFVPAWSPALCRHAVRDGVVPDGDPPVTREANFHARYIANTTADRRAAVLAVLTNKVGINVDRALQLRAAAVGRTEANRALKAYCMDWHRHSPHGHSPHSHNPHGHGPHSHCKFVFYICCVQPCMFSDVRPSFSLFLVRATRARPA